MRLVWAARCLEQKPLYPHTAGVRLRSLPRSSFVPCGLVLLWDGTWWPEAQTQVITRFQNLSDFNQGFAVGNCVCALGSR